MTRTADDRASALEADDVWAELIERLRADRERGPFAAVHVVPDSSGEVPDEMEARLVVLGPDYPHDTTGESKAKADGRRDPDQARPAAAHLSQRALVPRA